MRQSLVVHTILAAAVLLFVLLGCLGVAPPASAQLGTTVIFSDDFESGQGDWYADNGVWQMGHPTAGPGEPHSEQNCWATVLGANFTAYISSRLISPEIQLPTPTGQDELWLQFWTWADYVSSSYCGVQVRCQLPEGGWSGWNYLDQGHGFTYPGWARVWVDLREYAGEAVQIGFLHDPGGTESFGWCVDDVQIAVETPQFPPAEHFESGWDGWHADNGVWEVGTPTAGPGVAHGGTSCAATVLGGDFPVYISSRLISPTVQLPTLDTGDELWLRFYVWSDYLSSSYCGVQVSCQLPDGSWPGWAYLDTGYGFTYSGWTSVWVELSEYAGKTVRIGFLHDPGGTASFGWCIDDVWIGVETPQFRRPESFESHFGGWHLDNGVWEIGTPTAGPAGAHSGTTCIGTVLGGEFPVYISSRVTTSTIRLPSIPNPNPENEKLWLQFWTWADYVSSSYCYVQVMYQLPDGSWSGWEDLDTGEGVTNPVWARVRADLGAYAGKKVRIGFLHDPGGTPSFGWYIDDVTVLAHTSTAGLYNPATGTAFLRNSNTAGAADLTLRFGPAPNTWTPLSGNWDADWDDTTGLYDPAGGKFYLRNANSPGPADLTFRFGPTPCTWKPLAGDWDGDDTDSIGLYSQATGTVYLRNSNSAGPADLTFRFGPAPTTWLPITGDWDGDGIDTIGLYDPTAGKFYLRNSNSPGPADLTFRFGPVSSGWLPVAGDWNNDGVDTIGLYSPTTGTLYLRNDNSAGVANRTFRFGPAPSTWKPIVGEWHAD